MTLIPRGSGTGAMGKRYPPLDCSTLKAIPGDGRVSFTWTDPEDTTLGNITFSRWAGTKLVIKPDGWPQDERDGILVVDSKVRNQYKDTPFVAEGLTNQTTYYCVCFPYSDKNAVNYDYRATSIVKPEGFDLILRNNSWHTIIRAVNEGKAEDLWKIGDEADVVLTGQYAQTITMQIWGFDMEPLESDETKKAKITFGMKNLVKDVDGTNGRNDQYIEDYYLPCFPEELQQEIKKVKLVSYKGSGNSWVGGYTYQKIWIPSISNLDMSRDDVGDVLCHQYSVFTDDISRQKRLANGAGNISGYWLRDWCFNSSYRAVCNSLGYIPSGAAQVSVSQGLCLCFCL